MGDMPRRTNCSNNMCGPVPRRLGFERQRRMLRSSPNMTKTIHRRTVNQTMATPTASRVPTLYWLAQWSSGSTGIEAVESMMDKTKLWWGLEIVGVGHRKKERELIGEISK